MNPNLAAQGLRGRQNMAAPESVMDPRYAAWKKSQDDAELLGLMSDMAMSAVPLAGPAARGAMAAGRSLAPTAGRMLEDYMGRSGMMLNAAPESSKMLSIQPTHYKSAFNIEPPHQIRDKEKLTSLVNDMNNNGWQGRPILTYDIGRGDEAITGSHRIAAAKITNTEIPVYRIENAGDYLDKNGNSIADLPFLEPINQIKWLKEFGNKKAANLLSQEGEF
jgi:hypothetical protein